MTNTFHITHFIHCKYKNKILVRMALNKNAQSLKISSPKQQQQKTKKLRKKTLQTRSVERQKGDNTRQVPPSQNKSTNKSKRHYSYSHPPPPTFLSSNSRPTACVDEKWSGCLLVKAGTGANAVCISSDGMFVLMHYVWGGRDSCNIQQAREDVGEASTACSQRRLHLWVCVSSNWALSQLAGGSTHLETGRTLTQLPFFKSVIRIVTLTNTRLDTVGLHHTQKLFFYLRHKTHANTHKNTCTNTHFGCFFSLASHLNFHLKCPAHTQTHTHTQLLTLCTGLPWNRMVILHYGSTVIWGE